MVRSEPPVSSRVHCRGPSDPFRGWKKTLAGQGLQFSANRMRTLSWGTGARSISSMIALFRCLLLEVRFTLFRSPSLDVNGYCRFLCIVHRYSVLLSSYLIMTRFLPLSKASVRTITQLPCAPSFLHFSVLCTISYLNQSRQTGNHVWNIFTHRLLSMWRTALI